MYLSIWFLFNLLLKLKSVLINLSLELQVIIFSTNPRVPNRYNHLANSIKQNVLMKPNKSVVHFIHLMLVNFALMY